MPGSGTELVGDTETDWPQVLSPGMNCLRFLESGRPFQDQGPLMPLGQRAVQVLVLPACSLCPVAQASFLQPGAVHSRCRAGVEQEEGMEEQEPTVPGKLGCPSLETTGAVIPDSEYKQTRPC